VQLRVHKTTGNFDGKKFPDGRDGANRAVVTVHEGSIELHYAQNVGSSTLSHSLNAFVLFELPAVFEHIMSVSLRQQVPRCLPYAIRDLAITQQEFQFCLRFSNAG
jgi:hypothetical protein